MIAQVMGLSKAELNRMVWVLLGALLIATLFFSYQFNQNNIFTAEKPQILENKLVITQNTVESGVKVYLTDHWQTYDGALPPGKLPTSLNPSLQTATIATHNSAQDVWKYSAKDHVTTYRLSFYYQGDSKNAVLFFGTPYTQQQIWVNGVQLPIQYFAGIQSASVLSGENELVIVADHRYLGNDAMLTAPWVSSIVSTQTILFKQSLFYCAAILLAVILGGYTLILWGGNKMVLLYYDFSLFCFSFAVYCCSFFINAQSPTGYVAWQVLRQAAGLGMGWYLFCLAAQVAKYSDRIVYKNCLKPLTRVLCVAYLVVVVLSAATIYFAKLLILFEILYKLLLYAWLMFSCYWALRAQHSESEYLLVGTALYGSGLWVSILHYNNFAPTYGGWQMEWCGLALVLTYGCMMAKRNRRLLQENEDLNDNLLEMVGQRTLQLSKLLEERKKFFSEIVHDLKAPISAVNTFVELIRKHSVGVDDEMLKYLDMVQQKQAEMARRVQSLNEFNKIDGISSPISPVSLCRLLQDIYEYHNPEAEVLGVRMNLNLPEQDAIIIVSQEKMHVVFENLIYNALSFTKPNDCISITASRQNDMAVVRVADTGAGIDSQSLPHIFDRFFVGRQNKTEGSGLGLYIARQIVLEANGEISAESILGQGTVFTLKFPITSEFVC